MKETESGLMRHVFMQKVIELEKKKGDNMSTDEKSEADKLMESFVPTQVTLKGKYKLTKKTKLLLRHEENLMIVVQPVSLYRNGVSLEITVMKGVYTYGKQSPADIETGRSADKTESGKDKEGPQGTLPPA